VPDADPREEAAPGEGDERAAAGATPADDLAAAREAARRDFEREQAEAAAAKTRSRSARREDPSAEMRRGYARGRARDEAIRAQLTPLAPGERPLGLVLAFVVVLVVCGANAILAVTHEDYAYAALFAVGGVALAAGLWARIYAVVLLVEALLALAIIFAILALLFAQTWLVAAAIVGVVVVCSPVFWLLIRVMARMQVPRQ